MLERPRLLLPVVVAMACLLSACAHTIAEMASAATPAVITGGVDAFDDEVTRRRIVEILGSPEVQEAAHLLIARLTDGTLDALSNEERTDRIAAIADTFVTHLSESVGRSMHASIGPEVALLVSRSVDASLQRALSPENQARMASTVSTIVDRSVTALAVSMNSQLRPTIQAILREDLGSALRDGLRDRETQQALAAMMRGVAKQAVLGMQDGFAEIDAHDQSGRGRPTLLSGMQRLAVDGTNMVRYVAFGLGAAVVLLLAWLGFTRKRVKRATHEGARREAALISLAQALKAAEGKAWAGELKELIENALSGDDKAEYLQELWRKNSAIRFGPLPPKLAPAVLPDPPLDTAPALVPPIVSPLSPL